MNTNSNSAIAEPTEKEKGEVGAKLRIELIKRAPNIDALRSLVIGLPPAGRHVCLAILDRHAELNRPAA